jgi:hypothetical protein
VACTDVRLDRAGETAGTVVAAGGEALAFGADVRDRSAVQAALNAVVERWGALN